MASDEAPGARYQYSHVQEFRQPYAKPLPPLAHRYFQFYRPQPEAPGRVVAIKTLGIRTSRAALPALDVLTVGEGAGAAGPFLVVENALHEPERLPKPVYDAILAEIAARGVNALLNAGPSIAWLQGTELYQRYVADGGLLPGVTDIESEFGLATALRSVRSLLHGWPIHELHAPGYPWVARLLGRPVASYQPRSQTAHEVRASFEPVPRAPHSSGEAVVAFAGEIPELDLGGAPLVWIGARETAERVEVSLRDRYGDVERYGIVQRSSDYGFFPERVLDGLNVIVVHSKNARLDTPSPAPSALDANVTRAPLRLLVVARPDRKRYPIGGVETLIQQVCSAMQARGASVEIQETLTPNARGFDVAHVIGGLAENVIQQGQAVRDAGVPFALTPVFATYDGFQWFVGSSLTLHAEPRAEEQDRFTAAMRTRTLVAEPYEPAPKATDFRDLSMMRRGYALADNLFICAYGEAREIALRLGVYRPTTFIPNGVDTTVMRPNVPRVPIVPRRPYVLMATRIDAQKNLQGLFDATRNMRDLDVVVLGRIDVDSYPHAGIIMSNASANVIALPSVPLQSHPWFGSLFSNAAAVMVPSWAEVFSLNVLDAAACAVPVVMGHAGYHVELFGDLGYYVDPCDPLAIREAIEAAIAEDDATRMRRRTLAAKVHDEYGWERVGDMLYDAYREMARRGPVPVRGV